MSETSMRSGRDSSRVRGRIASVLSSARASLHEPVRPVTPQSVHLGPTTPSSSSSSSSNGSIQLGELYSTRLKPIVRAVEVEQESMVTVTSELDELLLDAEEYLAEGSAADMFKCLLRIFEFQTQIQNNFSASRLNELLRVLFSSIQSRALSSSWLLSHVLVLRVLLLSDEVLAPSIMRILVGSITFVCANISSLLNNSMQTVLFSTLDTISILLGMLKPLAPSIATQLHLPVNDVTSAVDDVSSDSCIGCFTQACFNCLNILKQIASHDTTSALLFSHQLLRVICDTSALISDMLARCQVASRRPVYSSTTVLGQLVDCLMLVSSTLAILCANPIHKKRLVGSVVLLAVMQQLRVTDRLYLLYLHAPIQELMLGILRVTSRLSLQEAHRAQVNNNTTALALFKQSFTFLVSEVGVGVPSIYLLILTAKLAFTLANLTTSNAENRKILGTQVNIVEPCVALLQLLARMFVQEYLDTIDHSIDADDMDNSKEQESESRSTSAKECASALVSLLRLLANLSIEEYVGVRVGNKCVVLELLVDLLSCSGAPAFEDLLLNTLATATNLTYYTCGCHRGASGLLDEKFLPTLVSMAAFLVQRLNHDNPEVRLEAVKAIGNLSRSTWVLDDLAQGPAYSKLIALLLAGDSVLQERVLGIFINASSHAASKELFFGGNREVLKAFLCVLRKCAIKHIIVSTQVCKALFNMTSGLSLLERAFGSDYMASLSITLFELVDCVEDLRGDVEGSEPELAAAYNAFYLTASSLYEAIDGSSHVDISETKTST